MSKILIHTTSSTEAKPIIDFFDLKKLNDSNIDELYSNEDLLLIISSTKKEQIEKSLKYIFDNYSISKAFDLSIASCSDGSVKLGTLFCTNKLIFGLNFANITTVQEELESDENLDTLLVDKQASYFKEICKENINDFYILKIVSDYFDEEKPQDKEIFELINNSINKWKELI
jgi:hypothetical protein